VLMFIYPLTITLILLCLFGRFFDYDQRVFVSVTAFTFVPALLDFINALPASVYSAIGGDALVSIGRHLPFFSIGMGWVVPACAGLVIGLILHTRSGRQKA